MKIQLVSAGTAICGKGVRGTKFFIYENEKIDETQPRFFTKMTYPIGYIMECDKVNDHQFKDFKLVDGSLEKIPQEFIDKYTMESFTNKKYLELEALQRRGANIEKQIDKMKVGYLKTYVHIHPERRREVIFYLLNMI